MPFQNQQTTVSLSSLPKTAEMELESSSLKLTMEKGPRAGETLEFTSRSVIKIGRIVRGNTIGIKDAGISTKHLSIQFDSAAGNWTLIDLESSNGTILNSVKLVPLKPAVIKDGDTVKIGEFTSFVVGIEMGEAGLSQLRRNPRRGKTRGLDTVGVGEGDCGQLGLGSGRNLGDSAVEEAPVKRNLGGRPPKGGVSKNEGLEVGVSMRRTRSSKKEEVYVQLEPTLPEVPKSFRADGADRKEPEKLVRKTRGGRRGRKNVSNDTSEKVENGDEVENLGGEDCGGSEKMAAVDEGFLNGSSEAGGVDVREEKGVENELIPLKVSSVDGSLPNGSLKGGGVDEREEKRVENDENSAGRVSKWLRKDGVLEELDLAKMTLGEWFHYLEVYLPKVIHDETEAMISSMKGQAVKFHEFRLQQEKLKDEGKRPME